jgi:hypothetical protein
MSGAPVIAESRQVLERVEVAVFASIFANHDRLFRFNTV